MFHWIRLCLLLLGATCSWKAFACSIQGVCDLTRVSWDESIPLAGDWQFYWKQLLTPDDINSGKGRLTGHLPLEKDWDGVEVSGVELHRGSYATYQLNIIIGKADPLTLRFPRIPAASALWVNGEEVSRMGQFSTEGREELARQGLFFHTFVPRVGLNTVTIEGSNFSYLFRGGNGGALIGKPKVILGDYQASLVRDSFSFGAILIMGFYHCYLWWIRKDRRSPLYFAIFCLAVGFRSLLSGQAQLLTFAFPDTPMELQFKIEYLGIALSCVSIVLLVHELYPREFPKILAYPCVVVSGFWALLILFTTANIYPLLLRTCQMCIVVGGTIELIALIVAAKRRREGAGTLLAGFFAFFASGVTDILMARGLIYTPPLLHVGTFTLVFFQAILLSRRFDRAYDQAEQAEKKVRSLNEGLEHMVKERTDQINTILRNVSSGFLLIDRQGILQPGFTDSCNNLLGSQLVAGSVLADCLPIDAKTKSMLRLTVNQVFEDFMPTEVSLSEIPYPIAIGKRLLGISGAVLRNEAGMVWAILFTINDVTRLQEAEKSVRYNEMLIGIIREQAAFKVFMEDFRKEIQQALTAIHSQNQMAVRTLLHTMKGNLGAFGMRQLAEFVHDIESHDSIIEENIVGLSQMMEKLLQDNKSLLGLERKEITFEVLRSDYNAIIAWSSQNLDARLHRELLKILKRACQNPIHSYIGPLQSSAERLGESLDKEVACRILGADIRVDERLAPVLRNLIHLVRNAVDHGIEMPEERGTKNRQGTIKIAFTQNEQELEIEVEDDGQGLNVDEIKATAKKQGLWPRERELSDEEIYKFIFAQGFSTATELSEISGRGIGMNAILESVEELSGKLHISSRPGLGVKVRIEIPLPADDRTLQSFNFAI